MVKTKHLLIAPLTFLVFTTISGAFLASSFTSAGDSISDKIKITVPESCSLSGTGMDSHNAEIQIGTYNSAVGETTIKAFFNDNEGFAIYAVGYTDNEAGKNVLSSSTLGSTHDIATGTAISGSNSAWAMKLSATSGTYTAIIAGSNADTLKEQNDPDFTSFQAVPSRYTKVAYRTSGTDAGTNAEGSTITTTYQAYISPTQPAGTYNGKVKYTLVHPNDHDAPVTHPAVLDTGKTINAKLKSVAATEVNGQETIITPTFDTDDEYDWEYAYDEYIKSISVHLETPAPNGFIPSEMNTISTSSSYKPVYIIFDNTNDAGIMHFYTEGERIVLSPDSSFMFYMLAALEDLSDISDWYTSNVTDMSEMFSDTSSSVSTFTIDLSSWDTSNVTSMFAMFYQFGYSSSTFYLDLSSWDTSSVTNMSWMFSEAGSSASTWFIGNLSSWDTSSVTNMSGMFARIGESVSTLVLDLSSWDTSNVTDMSRMFEQIGLNNVSTFTLNLSSWDTSSVTDMSGMFYEACRNASAWSVVGLSSWNTSSVTDMYEMFYQAGLHASTFTLDLSSWDTSSVTDMSEMFENAGLHASTWSVGDLSGWDSSNVTSMFAMFYGAGYSASTFILDLSSWDTSSVTDTSYMFYSAGYSASTFTLDLSSWKTSNVTGMDQMFDDAGHSATSWSVTIPATNGNNISNTTSNLYGQTTSVYDAPDDGRSFTLAQP